MIYDKVATYAMYVSYVTYRRITCSRPFLQRIKNTKTCPKTICLYGNQVFLASNLRNNISVKRKLNGNNIMSVKFNRFRHWDEIRVASIGRTLLEENLLLMPGVIFHKPSIEFSSLKHLLEQFS